METVTQDTCLFCYCPLGGRSDQKFCSDTCSKRYRRAQKAITIPDKLPGILKDAVRASSGLGDGSAAYPDDKIPPIQYSNRRYGDFDIRDTWARGPGTPITEDLPEFLRRRPLAAPPEAVPAPVGTEVA